MNLKKPIGFSHVLVIDHHIKFYFRSIIGREKFQWLEERVEKGRNGHYKYRLLF